MSNYYTLSVRDANKNLWDVVKYTNIPENGSITLTRSTMANKYVYTNDETIKSSLSYNDACNLAKILNKLTGTTTAGTWDFADNV